MKPCPVCDEPPELITRHDGGRNRLEDYVGCASIVCALRTVWMPLAAWDALPRRNPEAAKAVDELISAVGKRAISDWAIAYGNSRPDPEAQPRVVAARAAVLSMAVVPTTAPCRFCGEDRPVAVTTWCDGCRVHAPIYSAPRNPVAESPESPLSPVQPPAAAPESRSSIAMCRVCEVRPVKRGGGMWCEQCAAPAKGDTK